HLSRGDGARLSATLWPPRVPGLSGAGTAALSGRSGPIPAAGLRDATPAGLWRAAQPELSARLWRAAGLWRPAALRRAAKLRPAGLRPAGLRPAARRTAAKLCGSSSG